MTTPHTPNPYRVKLSVWLVEEGFSSLTEALEAHGYDSVVPALCTESCEVEPDGRCPHGCPSLLIAAGVI